MQNSKSLLLLASALFMLFCNQLAIAQSCDFVLLVSSWRTNNVKIYDGCNGTYIRDLDDGNRLAGPQAMVVDEAGDLYVVSERNSRVVRYKGDDLSYDQVVLGDRPETPEFENSGLSAPTGAVFVDERHLYVVNFNNNNSVIVDVTGADEAQTVLEGGMNGIQGPDIGLAVDFQRRVYIPGFDSSTIVRAPLDGNGPIERIVNSGAGGLDAPRAILINENNDMLVSSWRNDRILRFDAETGAARGIFSTNVNRPTSMIYRNADEILVASDNSNNVVRLNARTGQLLGTFINASSGGLRGATSMLMFRLQPSSLYENVQQIWLGGLAQIGDRELSTNNMQLTRNGFFGTDLQPETIQRSAWGTLSITFDSCNSGLMQYQANEDFFQEFGNGSYVITRLASSPAGRACEQSGFDQVSNNNWMSGVWYGGAARDGEGFSIDVLDGNRAIVTWYTYRSRQP